MFDEGTLSWIPSKTMDGVVGDFCGLTFRKKKSSQKTLQQLHPWSVFVLLRRVED